MSTIIGLVSTFRLPLHHTASKSNPPLFLAPFGLPCVSPPLKSPIRHPPANLPLTNKKGILTLSAMK